MTDELDVPIEIGSLLPLLRRANEVAKRLSEARYDGDVEWVAEVRVVMKYGSHLFGLKYPSPSERPPIYEVRVEIRRFLRSGYFTLEEAELIVENLAK